MTELDTLRATEPHPELAQWVIPPGGVVHEAHFEYRDRIKAWDYSLSMKLPWEYGLDGGLPLFNINVRTVSHLIRVMS